LHKIQNFLLQKNLQNDDAVWSENCEKILQISAILTRFLAIFLPFNHRPTKNTQFLSAFFVHFFVKSTVKKPKAYKIENYLT